MQTTNPNRFEEIVHHRRSIRLYKDLKIDNTRVKHCLELAALSPNSSNMQLWSFYHITSPDILSKMSKASLSQQAASTAAQMVVFVTRKDLYMKRAKEVLELETQNIINNSPIEKQKSRIKKRELYYGKAIPFLYSGLLGVMGALRLIMVNIIGLFRPIFYQVTENDNRVVLHKTCALAAQTFMLAMANEGYDTCPMEGFDSRMVKRILNLPCGAEINMVISCGIRDEQGVWGDRMRVPFNEVYKNV